MPVKGFLIFCVLAFISAACACKVKEPLICDTAPGTPFFFTIVTNDTQAVFTDSTENVKMYYYTGHVKEYITDLTLQKSVSRYKFILASTSVIKTNIDSSVQDFILKGLRA